jgi:hypothetical protein
MPFGGMGAGVFVEFDCSVENAQRAISAGRGEGIASISIEAYFS